MADKEFLKHFITEPVYIIPEQVPEQDVQQKEAPEPEEIIASEPAPEADRGLVFKGTNKRKVLIIVDQPGEAFISAATEAFLIKVLSAIQLNADDVGVLNLPENPGLKKEVLFAFDAEKYLVFGVSTSEILGDTFSPYEILKINENKYILNCSSLETIIADPSQKRLLWTALQKMFL